MLTWSLLIDWDGDGVLETDEAGRMIDLPAVDRGRTRMFGPGGLESMRVGRATVVLDNHDGRYDAWNTGSPLYPDILPGREAHLQVSNGVTTWDVFYGVIQDIEPTDYRNPRVRVVIDDGWRWLKANSAYTAVYEDLRTGEAIDELLTAAGWPWGKDVQAGTDRIPYWWAHGEAAQQLHELTEYEAGFVYVAGDGTLTFIARNSIYTADPADTVTQDEILKDLALGQPLNNLRNLVRIMASPRVEAAQSDVWTLRSTLRVRPGNTETVYAELRTPVVDAVSPVATTDYTFNSAEDGSGADLTASLSVTLTAYGQRLVLQMENTGALAGYVTLLKVRGKPLEADDALAAEEADATSQDDFGVRVYQESSRHSQSWLRADNKAKWLLGWMKSPTASPILRFEARPERQFGHDLGTLLALQLDKVGLDDKFLIGGVRHQWLDPNGQGVLTTWYLEPVKGSRYARWDVSKWDDALWAP